MCKKFRYYLGWKKFIIRTDHRPLLQIRSFQAPSCFEARLFNTLSTYDFDIEYREVSWGKSTIIAGEKMTVGEIGRRRVLFRGRGGARPARR